MATHKSTQPTPSDDLPSTKRCALSSCGRAFVPKGIHHKFCCLDCRMADAQIKRKGRGPRSPEMREYQRLWVKRRRSDPVFRAREQVRKRQRHLERYHSDPSYRRTIQKYQRDKYKKVSRLPLEAAGSVYFIQEEHGLIKIGKSRDADSRFRDLQQIVPYRLRLLLDIVTDDCGLLESTLHRRFALRRVHGEWFRLTWEQVEAVASEHGLRLKCTNGES